MRCFRWTDGQYVEAVLDSENPRFWIEELQLGLGVWQGNYKRATRSWLRWFKASGKWVLTEAEALAKERQLRLELVERLRQRGIDIDDL